MSGARMEMFRGFLTERFTTAAVDIFAEVESMIEACYEENTQLRRMLHMVLGPEIQLPRIGVDHLTGATTDVQQQPSPANTTLDQEITEPLPKRPKEEQTEFDISPGPEQAPLELQEIENFTQPVFKKSDSEDEDVSMPNIREFVQKELEALAHQTSSTISANEEKCEDDGLSSSESEIDAEERTNERVSTQLLQKTLVLFPRTMPNNSFAVAQSELHSFVTSLTEGFKRFNNEEKPLITRMGLTADVEMVSSSFGLVSKGSPLSYQCPPPSSLNCTAEKRPPPRPPLPLCEHMLEPLSSLPVLSPEELDHVDEMLITWAEANSLEQSTCGCTEYIEKLRKLRLTSSFKKICKLKPGDNCALKLISKIRKGPVFKPEEGIKAVALVEYCRRLCVNWSPCGLVVHPSAPWLGAVPDGLVYDPKVAKNFGLVHVQSITQSFNDCRFLASQDGLLWLRKEHKHYWHIQGEMLVTGTSWCDLLVISKDNILVQRIYRDSDIIDIMKRKLDEFFFFHYLPTIVSSGHKTSTGLA